MAGKLQGWVDPQEFVRAYELGIFKVDDPRYRTMLRLIKQWSQVTWESGFYSRNDYTLFHVGKAAMMWLGSWEATQLALDKERKFEFGVFPLPYFTRKTSPYATAGVARGPGGANSISIAIPSTVRDAGKLDITIDFLRYATAPQNLGPLVSEAEMFVPNCKNAKVSPLLKPFQDAIKNGLTRFSGEETTAQYVYQWEKIVQNYLGGLYTEDKTIKSLSYYLDLSVKEQLKNNCGQWKWGKNWEILPTNSGYDRAARAVNPAEGPVFYKFIAAIAVLPVLAGILLLFRGWMRPALPAESPGAIFFCCRLSQCWFCSATIPRFRRSITRFTSGRVVARRSGPVLQTSTRCFRTESSGIAARHA